VLAPALPHNARGIRGRLWPLGGLSLQLMRVVATGIRLQKGNNGRLLSDPAAEVPTLPKNDRNVRRMELSHETITLARQLSWKEMCTNAGVSAYTADDGDRSPHWSVGKAGD